MEHNSRRVPPDKRKRTEISCDKCKSRKQKCDRLLDRSQCRYCELNGIVCSTTQPRKQHGYVHDEDLRSRLDLLESLVKGLIPEADLSSNDELQHLGKSLGIPLPGVSQRGVSGKTKDNGAVAKDQELAASLLPDQQGHVQYIGPSSSFVFHNKLRLLMGSYTSREFATFGQNAADVTAFRPQTQSSGLPGSQIASSTLADYRSVLSTLGDQGGTLLNSLVDTYFDIIHPDFPVLHEATFRESYENWSSSVPSRNPVWLCSLFCVFILSQHVTPISIPENMEREWWAQVQALIPTVLFTTNIQTVQALLLAALHLHNNNHRDACWNLTGAALHVAIAMGLHRDDIKHAQTPFQREFRKQLWWTLYAFEKMQVSSYDRPSGISDTLTSAGYPNERIVGCAGHYPQGYLKHWQQLIVLLGSACKAVSTAKVAEDSYTRPLSPVSAIIRDLTRWKESLPAHLRLEATDSLPPSSRRPVLLLHAQCSYIVLLVSKSALLYRATSLCSPNEEDIPAPLRTVSETCIKAGQTLGDIMQRLGSIGMFNPFTWWDTFYTMNAALVLSLDIYCRTRSTVLEASNESQDLLDKLQELVAKHLRSASVPGSMRAWGAIVVDLATLSRNGTPVNHAITEDITPGGSHLQLEVGNVPMEAITLEQFNLLHGSFDLSQHLGI
ncbi:fungal-specific transcription factor domain-containing protein [Aspergillus karnatakaensis]|uniref:transcription factor domain-containing protein n=1 Tax=Aspergillus karnatakaensis TaxID=1810916 RepID=UPI003CCDF889